MLESILLFLSITVFHRRNQFLFSELILAACCHDNLARKREGKKKRLLFQRIWKLIQPLSDHYSPNTRGPFDLWENKCDRELWINEESKI